jgi:NTE family protein
LPVNGFARALALVALLLPACRTAEIPPERLPRFEPLASKPRIALVLGSGGPRGFAHIGVIKVLDEHGIKPDLVVGTSVGAMVGALYAAGRNGAALEELASRIKVAQFFELSMVGLGKATGEATQRYVNEQVGNKPIEALGMPFAAAATRVRDRQLVLFNRGDTGLATRASSANPDSFEPVRIGSEQYVDGDEVSPVPIRAARQLGARFVIAVDVSAFPEDTPPNVPRSWVDTDARRSAQIAREAPEADFMLHPNIGYYAGHSDEYRQRVITIAEAYTRSRMPALRAALARAGYATSTGPMPSGVASR